MTIKKRSTKWEVVERGLRILLLEKQGKTHKEISEIEGIDEAQVTREISESKSHLPNFVEIFDSAKNEGLLKPFQIGDEEKKRLRTIERRKQTMLNRIERDLDFFPSMPHFGFRKNRDRKVFPDPEEIKKLDGVLLDFLNEDKRLGQLAKTYSVSKNAVQTILRDPFNKGEFTYLGTTYTGRKWARISPQQYNMIQRKLPPRERGSWTLNYGYRWLDEDKVVFEPERKKILEVVYYLLENKGFKEIAGLTGLSKGLIREIKTNPNYTGLNGYPQIIDKGTFQKLQQMKPPAGPEIERKKGQQIRKKIKQALPAYCSELCEKLNLPYYVVWQHVQKLKHAKEPTIKERSDGLLQLEWLPFPENIVNTRYKQVRDKRQKILEAFYLPNEKLTRRDIRMKTGLKRHNVITHVRVLVKQGILKEDEHAKLQLSELGQKLR